MTSGQLILDGMPQTGVSEAGRARPSGFPASFAFAGVLEFHRAAGLPVRTTALGRIPPKERTLRLRLILEEAREFAEATVSADIEAIADSLADLVYVAYGAALHYGVNLDEAVRAVHQSNMSKIDPNGATLMRADGKVLKGPSYVPPKLDDALGIALDMFDSAERPRST